MKLLKKKRLDMDRPKKAITTKTSTATKPKECPKKIEWYVLWVTGDDYAAVYFEREYNHERQIALIKRLLKEDSGSDELKLEQAEVEIKLDQYGAIDPEFVKFIRYNIQDSDDVKHTNFYMFSVDEIKNSKVKPEIRVESSDEDE